MTATVNALQRTYPPRVKVPQPIGVESSWHAHFGYARYECSVCTCEWDGVDSGEPNRREESCGEDRRGCPCHDERFAASVYEGSAA